MNKPAFCLLLATSLAARADVVSFNVERWGGIPRTDTDTAGVVDSPYWNDGWLNFGLADGGYNGSTASDLWDDSGVATTLDASFVTFNTWTDNNADADPGVDTDGTHNIRLLHGYLNAGAAEWGPPTTISSITLSQIPYATYDIYVYFNSADNTRTGEVELGGTTYLFTSMAADVRGGDGNAVFAETTNTVDYTTSANYAVFTGLSGATQTFTADFTSGGNDAWGGIAGFQVVGTLPATVQINSDPEDQNVAVDEDASFSVSASGDLPHSFEWEYSVNGIDGWSTVPDETAATLLISGVDFPDEGFYRAVVTGAGSSATSDAAELTTFYAVPVFFEQPSDVVAEQGTTVELSADATVYGNPAYQWYKDDSPLVGEEDYILTLSGIGPGDEGEYFLRVTDDIEPGLFADSEVASVVTFPAWTGLVSHDPFDTGAGYALGELPAQDPAIAGYTGPWEDIDFGDAEPAIMSGSLNYPNPFYLGSSGDMVGKAADAIGLAAENSGRTYRLLSPELVVADNTTGVRYLSFLYRNGNENAADAPTIYSALALYNGDTADTSRSFEAGVADDAGIGANLMSRINNNGTAIADFGALDSDVHLFVVKFELSDLAFDDNVTVWMDPVLGGGDPSGGEVFEFWDLRFDRIAFSDYASNSVAWDEVRWGDSFDEVTLNPNPPEGYAAWIAGYDVGSLTGFDDDADGDGLDNGTEYYLGTDPSAFTQGLGQVMRSGNTFSFQHPQNGTPPSDVTGGYGWSTDLANWNADGEASGGTTVSFSAAPDTPEAGTTTVTATITGTLPGQLFVNFEAMEFAN